GREHSKKRANHSFPSYSDPACAAARGHCRPRRAGWRPRGEPLPGSRTRAEAAQGVDRLCV
ncbi:MAG: hypothetical protein AVDCRST_MAG37-2138, partial [uncultured Rubrobacteraceae bacterium]